MARGEFILNSLITISMAILFGLLIISPHNWQLVGAQSGQTCHLRELDLCAATLLVFTQSPGGLATSESEINKQCVHLREADTCMRNYTRRCTTPMQREMITFVSNSSAQMLDEYCTKNSQLRQNYLKHAQCLNQVQKKDQKGCVRDLQASLELLTSSGSGSGASENTKRLQLGCCAYRKFETCLGGHLEKRCGRETVAFVSALIRRISSRLPEIMCRSYRPEGQECKALLPKAGTIPKGAKSNSILSRLFSAYTGL